MSVWSRERERNQASTGRGAKKKKGNYPRMPEVEFNGINARGDEGTCRLCLRPIRARARITVSNGKWVHNACYQEERKKWVREYPQGKKTGGKKERN